MNGIDVRLPGKAVLPVMLASLLAGCAHPLYCKIAVPCPPAYSSVTLTDIEGRPIAQYIAEGDIVECCNSAYINAIQRQIYKPTTITFRYPFGRCVKVQGSHILIRPACKPMWLNG